MDGRAEHPHRKLAERSVRGIATPAVPSDGWTFPETSSRTKVPGEGFDHSLLSCASSPLRFITRSRSRGRRVIKGQIAKAGNKRVSPPAPSLPLLTPSENPRYWRHASRDQCGVLFAVFEGSRERIDLSRNNLMDGYPGIYPGMICQGMPLGVPGYLPGYEIYSGIPGYLPGYDIPSILQGYPGSYPGMVITTRLVTRVPQGIYPSKQSPWYGRGAPFVKESCLSLT